MAGAAVFRTGTADTGPPTRNDAEWQPIADVRFRETYQRAARAPNILELFARIGAKDRMDCQHLGYVHHTQT
jgi:hypothetical protein